MKRTLLGFASLTLLILGFSMCEGPTPGPGPNPGPDTTSKDTTTVDTLKPDPPKPDSTKYFASVAVEPVYDESGRGTILIVGGGASGVCAGIQAARLGVPVTIVEESPWVGGMLTAAGVTATDGCANLRGGLFKEFCDAVANHYGGYGNVSTGWVSNLLFEPKVGEQIFENLCAKEKNLTIVRNMYFENCQKLDKGWKVNFKTKTGQDVSYTCTILIDGTELGDVAKAAGVKYHIGMDSPSYGNESCAIGPNNDVQDITMVMTIKGFGRDMTIAKPKDYDASKYYNCCINSHNVNVVNGIDQVTGQSIKSPGEMFSYGQCPGGVYMINWPTHGNDYYDNIIEMSREERNAVIRKAKDHSLGFLYFMQTELGYKTYSLCNDQYPSEDNLPFYPYHRESRRIEGEYLFTVNDLVNPFTVPHPAYRTGIAVGDYPVDHHHNEHPNWINLKINFPSIKSFSLPLGCVVPLEVEDLIVAEKSISVTNIANGTTRLQPVCVELGQAVGTLAALSIKYNKSVREVDVRKVQSELIRSGALLQPFRDALASNPDFAVIERIACTGILRGTYTTQGWSNIANFNPRSGLKACDLFLDDYYGIPETTSTAAVTDKILKETIEQIIGLELTDWTTDGHPLTRLEGAKIIDKYLNPFWKQVDWNGELVNKTDE